MIGHIWTKFLNGVETVVHFIAYLTSWGGGFAGSENKFQKMEDKFFQSSRGSSSDSKKTENNNN